MVHFNYLLYSFIAILSASTTLRWLLSHINIAYLRRHGKDAPESFEGELDVETLSRMTDYSVDTSRLESFESILDDVAILVLLLSGALSWLVQMVARHVNGPVLSGILFFSVLLILKYIMEIPFGIYSTFVIEKKYGFSTITPRLWISDLFKEILISLVLMVLLLGPVLGLVYHVKTYWWLLVWIFFVSFQVFLLWIYPVVIIPMFYEYSEVEDQDLKSDIISIAEKAGIEVKGIYQINAGKRSRHTNAFFTGMGKTKRIVLYDTLIESHAKDEILSILAHEMGHWKRRHVLKQAFLMAIASFAVLFFSSYLINWPVLYTTFGINPKIKYAGLFLIVIMLRPSAFFFTPVVSSISRRFEIQADTYSYNVMQSAKPLIKALKRIAKENLANLFPHPAFAWFYYSHPPITERLGYLKEMERDTM